MCKENEVFNTIAIIITNKNIKNTTQIAKNAINAINNLNDQNHTLLLFVGANRLLAKQIIQEIDENRKFIDYYFEINNNGLKNFKKYLKENFNFASFYIFGSWIDVSKLERLFKKNNFKNIQTWW